MAGLRWVAVGKDAAIISGRRGRRQTTRSIVGVEVTRRVPREPRPDSVIGMEFFQLAGEMGSTAAPAVVRRALAANPNAVA